METATNDSGQHYMQPDEQSNLQPFLHSQSTVQPCNARIPGQVDNLVPAELVWNGKCTTADQYVALCTATYNLLVIKQVNKNGEEKPFLQFKFLDDLQPTSMPFSNPFASSTQEETKQSAAANPY